MRHHPVDAVRRVREPLGHLLHRAPTAQCRLRTRVDGALHGQFPAPDQTPVNRLLTRGTDQNEHAAGPQQVQRQVDRVRVADAVEHCVHPLLEDRHLGHPRPYNPPAVAGSEFLHRTGAGGQNARGTGLQRTSGTELARADHRDVQIRVQHPQSRRH